MGYQIVATPDVSSIRAMEEEVYKKIDTFENMLLQSAEKCEDQGVTSLLIDVSCTLFFNCVYLN